MGNTKMENKMDYKTIKNLIQNDEGIGMFQSALETWCPSMATKGMDLIGVTIGGIMGLIYG